jgi:hypothetical protein
VTRLHTDPVEVQRRDDEPALFLWRGRLFAVRAVLAHWTEAGSWWSGSAVRAFASGDAAAAGPGAAGPLQTGPLQTAPLPFSPAGAPRAWGEPAPDAGADAGPVLLDDRERDWWRVEAGAGRSAATGVYDLCFDGSRGSWTLARVLD